MNGLKKITMMILVDSLFGMMKGRLVVVLSAVKNLGFAVTDGHYFVFSIDEGPFDGFEKALSVRRGSHLLSRW